MITIRTFGNLAEAGFAKSLLEAAGIPAELPDENFYSIGYGPGLGGLRLQVDESDLERARQVLEKGLEAPEPTSEEILNAPPESQLPPPGSRFPAGIFIAAIVVFGVLVFAAYQLRKSDRERPNSPGNRNHVYEYDDNHDGVIERRATYKDGRIAKAEIDRNGDRRMDTWYEYDFGVIRSLTADNNFDGKPDVWQEYKDGDLVAGRTDVDFNGVPDTLTHYRSHLPVSTDIAPNGSKIVFRRQLFEHGILREELVDEDHDGKFDYRIKFDSFGQPSEHLAIEAEK